MGQEKEEDKSSGRRYYYGYYGRNDQKDEKPKDKFRVAANARYRQVLLWANETEMAEVRSLLIKLGELPPPGGSRKTIRIIDASATPETYQYLQRLKQQWDQLSPNPLELPNQDQFTEPNMAPGNKLPTEKGKSEEQGEGEEQGEKKKDAAPQEKPEAEGDDEGSTLARSSARQRFRLTVVQNRVEPTEDQQPIRSGEQFDRVFGIPEPAPEQPKKADKPPAIIRIEVDREGNIVLTSPDTDALDRLENLMLQVAPPKRPYHVFHIEHASAFWMRLNLEDYYADLKEDEESEGDRFYRWWNNEDKPEDDASGLGKGVKLRFVDDMDTNTLVVTGATARQLRTIAELIELWDVPEPVNKRKNRFTRLVTVQFGRADKISETVKEAYRDLLSSNDKAFSAGQGQNQARGRNQNQTSKSRNGSGSSLLDSESGRDGGGADFSFKGKLSMGVDSVGNTLLVSAEGEPLLELVIGMIEKLDEAARPSGEIHVIQLPGNLSGRTLQLALKAMGAEPPERRIDENRNDNNNQNAERRGRGRRGDSQRLDGNADVDASR